MIIIVYVIRGWGSNAHALAQFILPAQCSNVAPAVIFYAVVESELDYCCVKDAFRGAGCACKYLVLLAAAVTTLQRQARHVSDFVCWPNSKIAGNRLLVLYRYSMSQTVDAPCGVSHLSLS